MKDQKSDSLDHAKTGTSRRKFIGGGAAAAAGTALSSVSVATHAHAAGSDSLKVSLVGCGGRGRGASAQHLLNEGTELVAMADIYRHRIDEGYDIITKEVAKKGPGKVKVSEDNKLVGLDAYKEAIEKADTVILTTPPGFRPMMFEYAVEAGKNIFMEKPVATDAKGYRRVMAAAKQADKKGLKVVCGLQRRYQDHYIQAFEEVKSGKIGRITAAQSYWNSGGVWTRPRASMAEFLGREPTEMEYQLYNWYYFNWVCGDHICEQHIHNLDVINWFTGDKPPVKAQGMGGREVRTGPDTGEIFDHHYVEFQYENGVYNNSQCRHQPGCANKVAETLIGTKGRLELSNKGGGMFYDHKGNVTDRVRINDVRNPYEVEHAELVKHIRQNQPVNDAYYTAKSTMTAILGRYATYSGKEVTWEEAAKSQVDLFPDDLAWDADPKLMPDADGNYPVAIPGVSKIF